ncbi:hypothetical protein GCM10009809_41860 [Isoptericola hypogeus]|uniref:Peptidoglycan binding-like domain-containing protein n=1 Tax=Isoptericola hypogeus TaxID=300179 RepID=A0ABP4VYH2_9MICO
MSTMRFGGRTYRNGDLPSAVLDELVPFGRHGTSAASRAFLRSDAAGSWNRAAREIRSEAGLDLTARGWNRSRSEQEAFFLQRYRRGARSPYGDYRRYAGSTWGRVDGAAAAVPGYSNHGWGLAVDVNDFGGVGEFGNARRGAAFPILRNHGWTETEGRRVDEPWHLVYSPSADRGAGRRSAAAESRRPRRPPTIKLGSRTPRWTRLWKAFLAAERVYGANTGPSFGEELEEATRTWQKRAGIVPDGVVGPKTWFAAIEDVRPGRKGPAVKIAQEIAGLTGRHVDGVAGSVFATRWKQIQRWLGVVPDARIGDATIAALVRKA